MTKKFLRTPKDLSTVYDYITTNILTMVSKERFETIDRLSNLLRHDNIEGDIVECGCWRGGMSMYLAHSFPERQIWVCDSFEGFEDLSQATIRWTAPDPHRPSFSEVAVNIDGQSHGPQSLIAPYDKVIKDFEGIGLSEKEGIIFLKGFVRNTLAPDTCEIKKIALLRIDVDAYSATMDVLENLYDNVVKGGYIIFDDTGIPSANSAINVFFHKRGIKHRFYSAEGAALKKPPRNTTKPGSYIKK